MQMHSVALVDDHPVFREVVGMLLRRQPDLHVVAEVGTASEAVRVIENDGPRVVVLDLELSTDDGLEVARWAKANAKTTRILILSNYEEERIVARALSAGADGYAYKSQSCEELAEAIRIVASGGRYFAPAISLEAVNACLARESGLSQLTAREREVFDHTIRGHSTKHTAATLDISPRTVETHRSHILEKLQVNSALDLVRLAAQLGLLKD